MARALAADIAERKRTEEALRESEDKYRSLYSNMSEGVAIHEIIYDDLGQAIDYRILDINPSFESLTGISKEQALSLKASELYGTGYSPYIEIYANVVDTGIPVLFETYFKSVDILEDLGMEAYKVSSPITVGFQALIAAMARKNKPLLMSVGYCTSAEIERAVKTVAKSGNKKLVLLYCLASYPTLLAQDVNLGFMKSLAKKFNCLVGFSDHTMSTAIPATAVAMGARVIEKHFTLSRKFKGPDHEFALEPKELAEMVKNIRDAEKIMGKKRKILPYEINMKKKVMMKLVASRNLAAGTVLKPGHIIFRRAPGGVEEYKIKKIIGKKLTKSVKAMTLISLTDIK
jgi:sialic acid synthase SpsE